MVDNHLIMTSSHLAFELRQLMIYVELAYQIEIRSPEQSVIFVQEVCIGGRPDISWLLLMLNISITACNHAFVSLVSWGVIVYDRNSILAQIGGILSRLRRPPLKNSPGQLLCSPLLCVSHFLFVFLIARNKACSFY